MCGGVVEAPSGSACISRCSARIRGGIPLGRGGRGGGIPFGLAKAGLFSGCPVVLGIVAASEEGAEDA